MAATAAFADPRLAIGMKVSVCERYSTISLFLLHTSTCTNNTHTFRVTKVFSLACWLAGWLAGCLSDCLRQTDRHGIKADWGEKFYWDENSYLGTKVRLEKKSQTGEKVRLGKKIQTGEEKV